MLKENTQIHGVNLVHYPTASIVKTWGLKLCYLTGDKYYFYNLVYKAKLSLG